MKETKEVGEMTILCNVQGHGVYDKEAGGCPLCTQGGNMKETVKILHNRYIKDTLSVSYN